MLRQLIILGISQLLLGIGSSSLEIDFVKKVYRVVPTNSVQLETLTQLVSEHPEILVWKKVKQIGEAVELLATEEDMDRYQQETLNNVNLQATMRETFVKIIISKENSQSPQECTQPIPIEELIEERNRSARIATVPILAIPGTNLFTGIYYKISNKNLNKSWLTWSWKNKKLRVYTDRYLIADTTGSADYVPGAAFYEDSQWMFVPSEIDGWYSWVNRALTDMISEYRPTALSEDCSENGRMLEVYRKYTKNSRLQIGGDWRWKVYWKPVASEEDGYFKIINKNHGALTYSERTDGEFGNYLQVVKNDAESPEAMKHKFYPQNVVLKAQLSGFKFEDTPETLLEQYTAGKEDATPIFRKIITNPDNLETIFPLEEAFTSKNSFSWKIQQNLSIFRNVTTKVEVPLVASDEIDTVLGVEIDLRGYQEWTQETTRENEISQEVKINSSVMISAYRRYIKNLPLEFTADIEITGTVDGREMTKDGQGAHVKNTAAPADLIYQIVKDNGFEAELITLEDNIVRYRVKGLFIGTFGFKEILSVDEVPISSEDTIPQVWI